MAWELSRSTQQERLEARGTAMLAQPHHGTTKETCTDSDGQKQGTNADDRTEACVARPPAELLPLVPCARMETSMPLSYIVE